MIDSVSRPAWPKLAVVLVVFAALAAFVIFGNARFLSLDTVKMHAAALRAFTEAHYLAELAISLAVYAAAASLSLPGGTVLSLTFGFLFGRWIAALVVTAATLGATLLFLTVRYLFGEAARARLGRSAKKSMPSSSPTDSAGFFSCG